MWDQYRVWIDRVMDKFIFIKCYEAVYCEI